MTDPASGTSGTPAAAIGIVVSLVLAAFISLRVWAIAIAWVLVGGATHLGHATRRHMSDPTRL